MKFDHVYQRDCIEWMLKRPGPFVDLVFADPPFNIGYLYDVYEDRKAYGEYYDWTRDWMKAACYVLKPAGALWVAIGAEYAAEVRMIGRELGLSLRNWVIWHYTFGQNTKAKFARAHTHLFYFTKSPTEFTFNADAVRVMSDRQKEYHDKRAHPLGKIPFDVWTEFPRLCGTFQAREGWHPCQMPESVLGRIIKSCSNVGDVVYDPFAGSGTTLVVAKKLGRRFLGTEMSASYVEGIRRRLAGVDEAEPQPRPKRRGKAAATEDPLWPPTHVEELGNLYMETALATDTLHENEYLFETFCKQFNMRMANLGFDGVYPPEEIWAQLEFLRQTMKLGRIKAHVKEPVKGKARPAPKVGRQRSLFERGQEGAEE